MTLDIEVPLLGDETIKSPHGLILLVTGKGVDVIAVGGEGEGVEEGALG